MPAKRFRRRADAQSQRKKIDPNKVLVMIVAAPIMLLVGVVWGGLFGSCLGIQGVVMGALFGIGLAIYGSWALCKHSAK